MRFLVNTDHCRTLNREFSHVIAARFNSSKDPIKFSKALISEGIIDKKGNKILDKEGKRILLPESEYQAYLKSMNKSEFDNLGDIAKCVTEARFAGRIPVEHAYSIIQHTLVGLTKEDLKRAQNAAVETITKGAKEYSKWVKENRGHHIVLSDGIHQIVKAVADELGNIDFVSARELIFENGKSNGVKLTSKWKTAYKLYEDLGFPMTKEGVYRFTISVDDSAFEIDEMKKHDRPIAFFPNEIDEKIFAKEGLKIAIVRVEDFSRVISLIENYLAYASVRYK